MFPIFLLYYTLIILYTISRDFLYLRFKLNILCLKQTFLSEGADFIKKLAICQSNSTDAEEIETIIRNNFKDIYINTYSSLSELDKARDLIEFDIYILSIELEPISGFNYASKIRETNKDCQIAIISSKDDYAVNGYRIGINAYIVKPFEEDSIIKMVHRLSKNLKLSSKIVVIKENYNDVPVLIKDIDYIQYKNRKTYLVTSSDTYETNESFTNLIDRINSDKIIKVSRSLAINKASIIDLSCSESKYIFKFASGDLPLDKRSFTKLKNKLN